MEDISVSKSNHGGSVVVLNIEASSTVKETSHPSVPFEKDESEPLFSVQFLQKLVAELLGTYYLIFAGCAAIAVNAQRHDVVTLVGIAIVWGLVIMVLVCSLGHVSAHFNPAVTIAFASVRRFPLKQILPYIAVQVIGSTLASATLRLLFDLNNDVCSKKHDVFLGSSPSGSDLQAFVMEFIITGFLMFVVSAIATDSRTSEELAGLIFGATVTLNVIFAGEISGASMNPARSLGPALVWGCYKGIWIYLLAPTLGAVSGAWIYNLLRCTEKTELETSKTGSSHKRVHDVPV
ncbi:PREDICTED: aquaporin NIP2-1 [Tarenaya hassleriana]|uniref:aquaporin NIP2-1 n=1 Tax=Tarenaya hassleriana TaxID=28532 RepID=UPI00053C22BD|nr:PREDICTED: aquaporin NIP2-1 [Tarenaya hassleriana]